MVAETTIVGGWMLWPVALVYFYTAPQISVFHPSCCTLEHKWHSSTIPFHSLLKRSRKNHERPLLLTLYAGLTQSWGGWNPTDRKDCPFSLPLDSSAAQNRVMLQGTILLCALTHARSHQSRPSSPQNGNADPFPMLYFMGNLFLLLIASGSCLGQHKHLFHVTFWAGSS